MRSSSLLEDALDHPFAGVYETKMIANDRPDADTRFRRLVEAIKLAAFEPFRPCGLDPKVMTSLARLLGLERLDLAEAKRRVTASFAEVFGRRAAPAP